MAIIIPLLFLCNYIKVFYIYYLCVCVFVYGGKERMNMVYGSQLTRISSPCTCGFHQAMPTGRFSLCEFTFNFLN